MPEEKKTLTFASANLFNFLAPPNAYYEFDNIYDNRAWQDKCHWTKQTLKRLNADVIGLQEVFSIACARDLMAEIGYPYFATVDEPEVEKDYIYTKPVVALASRYPILSYREVPVLADHDHLHIPNFSRKPICAYISVPELGKITVYVCHLKSQRLIETDQPEPFVGHWLSSIQRGWEAVMLRTFMHFEYAKHPTPTVLMGDMNQSISSDILTSLTEPGHSISGLYLKDSWSMFDTPTTRAPTHYHFAKGNTLDYLLVSQEFDPNWSCSMLEVVDYTVLDKHLTNPHSQQDRYASDHAFVALKVNILV